MKPAKQNVSKRSVIKSDRIYRTTQRKNETVLIWQLYTKNNYPNYTRNTIYVMIHLQIVTFSHAFFNFVKNELYSTWALFPC